MVVGVLRGGRLTTLLYVVEMFDDWTMEDLMSYDWDCKLTVVATFCFLSVVGFDCTG
jgi:hypothetical protein